MHTQHLIGRVKQVQADLRSVSEALHFRGHTVMAEELLREGKSMEGLLQTLRADLAQERRQDEASKAASLASKGDQPGWTARMLAKLDEMQQYKEAEVPLDGKISNARANLTDTAR